MNHDQEEEIELHDLESLQQRLSTELGQSDRPQDAASSADGDGFLIT